MFSGRHLVLLGLLCAAGLLSVRVSQEQVATGYQLGLLEAQLRKAEENRAAAQARLLVLQAPAQVIKRTNELKLGMLPDNPLSVFRVPEPPKNGAH